VPSSSSSGSWNVSGGQVLRALLPLALLASVGAVLALLFREPLANAARVVLGRYQPLQDDGDFELASMQVCVWGRGGGICSGEGVWVGEALFGHEGGVEASRGRGQGGRLPGWEGAGEGTGWEVAAV
jgi:hypothetical protein